MRVLSRGVAEVVDEYLTRTLTLTLTLSPTPNLTLTLTLTEVVDDPRHGRAVLVSELLALTLTLTLALALTLTLTLALALTLTLRGTRTPHSRPSSSRSY